MQYFLFYKIYVKISFYLHVVNIKVIKIYIGLRIEVALKKHVSRRFFPTPKVKKNVQGTCNKTQKIS